MPETIVVLDGHTLTPAQPSQPIPGEPAWADLESLGELTVYPLTSKQQIIERAQHATMVLTNKTPLSGETIAALPNLKYIGILATGVNVVDLEAADAAGVTVANAPGYSTDSVAQHVFGLLLEIASRVGEHDHAVHEGQWSGGEGFSFTLTPTFELANKTLGIVGVGDIGKRVAAIGAALGMRIAAAHQSSMNRTSVPGVEINWLPHDELFAAADVVTLHCPLTDKTQGLVGPAMLDRMKRGAILINTGRGQLLDEPAVAEALNTGKLAAAGLDVLSQEPPNPSNPLLSAENCVITPHNAWATRESRQRLMQIVSANANAFINGEPTNVVKP